MLKAVFVVVLIGLVVWFLLPAKEGLSFFQNTSQFFVNRLDSEYSTIIDKRELNNMKLTGSLCYRNSDCKLVMCGVKPNEYSASVNVHASVNESLKCNNVDGEVVWDGVTKCVEKQCVFTRMSSSQ